MVIGISSSSISTTDLLNCTKITSSSASNMASGVLDAYLKTFAESFSTETEHTNKKKEMLKSLLEKADTDKDGGLSLNELYSVDTGDDKNEKEAVSCLTEQFKSLDINGDGVLSLSEMQNVKLKQRYSIEELSQMYNSMKNSNKNGNLTNMYSCLEKVIIKNYTSDSMSASNGTIEVEA